jgi:hypothetical protein
VRNSINFKLKNDSGKFIFQGCGNQIYDYAEVVYLKSKENNEITGGTEVCKNVAIYCCCT